MREFLFSAAFVAAVTTAMIWVLPGQAQSGPIVAQVYRTYGRGGAEITCYMVAGYMASLSCVVIP